MDLFVFDEILYKYDSLPNLHRLFWWELNIFSCFNFFFKQQVFGDFSYYLKKLRGACILIEGTATANTGIAGLPRRWSHRFFPRSSITDFFTSKKQL